MIPNQADFVDGQVKWSEATTTKYYPENRQLGMFVDRPDLWKKKARRAHPTKPGQLSLDLERSANANEVELAPPNQPRKEGEN